MIDREIHADEVTRMRAYLATHIPALDNTCLQAATCMYTNTPDQDFVVATHPVYPQVAIAAGFSGHGYKFASVVGEILADLAVEGCTKHPIQLFAPKRFS
jgi:sarcosine oxidase